MVWKITKKFIHPEDGPILEGGCGLGNHVYFKYKQIKDFKKNKKVY